MKKIILILAGILAFNHFSHSQIGINTSTPDSSAAIDIRSPANENRGALLPRMTKQERLSISSPATSLLVFDTDEKIFYYFDGSAWVGLLPKENPTSNLTVEGDLKIDVGSVRAPNVRTDTLLVPGFSRNALVPTGAIIMWSGSVTNLPVGWALCDGTAHIGNGYTLFNPFYTPDLKGKFIVGYDPNSSTSPTVALNNGIEVNYGKVGNTGGETGHILTNPELPKHSHSANGDGATIMINNSGSHSHSFTSPSGASNGREFSGGSNNIGDLGSRTLDELHNHPNSSFSGITGNGSGDGLDDKVHENRPPYFVLAYIIKLP